MQEITLTFVREKETKNTVRYQEQPPTGQAPVVTTLYLQKKVLGANPPQEVRVVISPVYGAPTSD